MLHPMEREVSGIATGQMAPGLATMSTIPRPRRKADRSDRVLLLAAIALALRALPGTAGEACGPNRLDRLLTTNARGSASPRLAIRDLRPYALARMGAWTSSSCRRALEADLGPRAICTAALGLN